MDDDLKGFGSRGSRAEVLPWHFTGGTEENESHETLIYKSRSLP
jgi:hypothetical protein